MNTANIPINLNGTTVTLADGTILPDCKPEFRTAVALSVE